MAWEDLKAKDIMSKPVRTIERDLALEEAVRVLTDEGYSGAPVINRRGDLVGVITLYDVMTYVAGLERSLGKLGHFYFRSFLRWDGGSGTAANLDFEDDLLKETPVDDVMTPEIVDVAPDTPLPEVVSKMCERDIHRVLVTKDGKIQGMVTTMDVMKALKG